MLQVFPEKPKRQPNYEDKYPYTMFYARLMLALVIPASLLCAILLLPAMVMSWLVG